MFSRRSTEANMRRYTIDLERLKSFRRAYREANAFVRDILKDVQNASENTKYAEIAARDPRLHRDEVAAARKRVEQANEDLNRRRAEYQDASQRAQHAGRVWNKISEYVREHGDNDAQRIVKEAF